MNFKLHVLNLFLAKVAGPLFLGFFSMYIDTAFISQVTYWKHTPDMDYY